MANGGFIGKRTVPSPTSASAVWGLNEAYNAILDGIYPSLSTPVLTNFLIIAGGGGGGQDDGEGGGGAGGYLNSYGSEASGENSASLSALSCELNNLYAVTIGAGGAYNSNGSNSSLSGTASDLSSISLTAIGGGRGGNGGDGSLGGSGGASGIDPSNANIVRAAGAGTSNQGFAGGVSDGIAANPSLCNSMGGNFCIVSTYKGAGGGGAGAVGASGPNNGAGGAGLASSITGTSITRAAGGSGRGKQNGNSAAMPTGSGSSSSGGGGQGGQNSGGNGIIILRYSSLFSLSNPGGGLTISTATVGSDKVSSITAGSGNFQFS